MNLALDTNAVIDVLRGREPLYRQRLVEAERAGAILHLPTFVFHELMFGAMISADPMGQMARVDTLAARLQVHDWTSDDAIAAARLRADLRKTGQTIGGFDAVIAGQALARGWTMVTGNLSEFIRVPSLPLIDWRISDQVLDVNAMTSDFLKKLKRK